MTGTRSLADPPQTELAGAGAASQNYKFSTSLFDVVMLSVLRTLMLMVAYLVFGERQNCHKPYLWATHLSLLLTLAFIFAKVGFATQYPETCCDAG